jgi:transcriptional regulator with XRE-family HTH domain
MDESMGTTIEIWFGHTIRKRRKELGLSQGQAAERAGVSRNYWGMMERGMAQNPSLEIMRKMAWAVGLRIAVSMNERDGKR